MATKEIHGKPEPPVRIAVGDPAQLRGKFKRMGGSQSDDWNNRIVTDTAAERVTGSGDAERPMPNARWPVPGAPKGNQIARKHGRYTAEAIERRRRVTALIRSARKLVC